MITRRIDSCTYRYRHTRPQRSGLLDMARIAVGNGTQNLPIGDSLFALDVGTYQAAVVRVAEAAGAEAAGAGTAVAVSDATGAGTAAGAWTAAPALLAP